MSSPPPNVDADVQVSTKPQDVAYAYIAHLTSQLTIAYNEMYWLYVDLKHHIITISCPCGSQVGIDTQTMKTFVTSIRSMLYGILDAMRFPYDSSDIQYKLEMWSYILTGYNQRIKDAWKNTHLNNKNEMCTELDNSKVVCDALTRRKTRINKVLTIIHRLMIFESFE
jgi:hypothetical protein